MRDSKSKEVGLHPQLFTVLQTDHLFSYQFISESSLFFPCLWLGAPTLNEMTVNAITGSIGNVARGVAKVVSAVTGASCSGGVSSNVSAFASAVQRRTPTAKKPSPLPRELQTHLNGSNRAKMRTAVYRTVPSTRAARAAGFGTLFLRLGWDKLVGSEAGDKMLPVNSHMRIVETLCRMRGAVMKLGQMLSIQDDNTIPSNITSLFERVRDSAYAMPPKQLEQTLAKEYNDKNWRQELFKEFITEPIAAASIGQVHRAAVSDQDTGEKVAVAVKVQYPGVAQSIDSDVANLRMLMSLNILPPGMFVDNILDELQQELKTECSYSKEAEKQLRYAELLQQSPELKEVFVVPKVYKSLSTDRVLVTQMLSGVSIDKLASLVGMQDVKDYVARSMLHLTLTELFQWRFMQTDPNYSNFLFCPQTNKIGLIDFGAAREYNQEFVKDYLDVVAAAARRDRQTVIEKSIKLGFLKGNEMKEMLDAHAESVLLLGLPFNNRDVPFDFSKENLPSRIQGYVPTIVRLRLCPPPTPIYSLHRRLSGAILLSTKLKATVPSGELFWNIYDELTSV
ncbi:ABC1 protein [Trypanosoma brucei equiperdum]|uniref:ABC1 protein n=1 Tax=Trypanosoma brucei equiperdum TaxID=630700 RepID=A0A3L6L3V4_9TRYP|nr:ABC1 protein [Trypanosoma brucei equiperdum]